MKKKSQFASDFRKSKPNLHMLYVKWACQHLVAIDQCLERLDSFSNLNLADIMVAMQEERAKLLRENAAYADAQEILEGIGHAKAGTLPDVPEAEKEELIDAESDDLA